MQGLVPVCDLILLPLRLTVKVAVTGHVCDTTTGASHYFQGVGVQLTRHLQAKKVLHFSERVFK